MLQLFRVDPQLDFTKITMAKVKTSVLFNHYDQQQSLLQPLCLEGVYVENLR
jgi:hypothetical protein